MTNYNIFSGVPCDASLSMAPAATSTAPGPRPLVLIVDDVDATASLLCTQFRRLNCIPHRAENGEVAIEKVTSAPAQYRYSFILMDLHMPIMDGFEATAILKSGNDSNIPVVALTGYGREDKRRKCNEVGFDDYYTKPLKQSQLLELLDKYAPGHRCSG